MKITQNLQEMLFFQKENIEQKTVLAQSHPGSSFNFKEILSTAIETSKQSEKKEITNPISENAFKEESFGPKLIENFKSERLDEKEQTGINKSGKSEVEDKKSILDSNEEKQIQILEYSNEPSFYSELKTTEKINDTSKSEGSTKEKQHDDKNIVVTSDKTNKKPLRDIKADIKLKEKIEKSVTNNSVANEKMIYVQQVAKEPFLENKRINLEETKSEIKSSRQKFTEQNYRNKDSQLNYLNNIIPEKKNNNEQIGLFLRENERTENKKIENSQKKPVTNAIIENKNQESISGKAKVSQGTHDFSNIKKEEIEIKSPKEYLEMFNVKHKEANKKQSASSKNEPTQGSDKDKKFESDNNSSNVIVSLGSKWSIDRRIQEIDSNNADKNNKENKLGTKELAIKQVQIQKNENQSFSSVQTEKQDSISLLAQTAERNGLIKLNQSKEILKSSGVRREELKENINEMVKQARIQILDNGKSSAQISLQPKDLGRMTLNIIINQDRVEGKILVESEKVKNLLIGDLGQLKSELKANGLNLEFLTIEARSENFSSNEFFEDSSGKENWQSADTNKNGHMDVALSDDRDVEYEYKSNNIIDIKV